MIAEITASENFLIFGLNADYATARNTSFQKTTTLLYAGQQIVGSYYVFRSFLSFDTSSLSGKVVNQANMVLAISDDSSVTDFDVQIIESNWYGKTNEEQYDDCLAAINSVLWRNTNGISTNTPYTSGNLSVDYLNLSGLTYYSVRSSRDYAGNAPTGAEYIAFYKIADAESYRPKLVVDYSNPSHPFYMFLKNNRRHL